MQSLCFASAPFSLKPPLSPLVTCQSMYPKRSFFDRAADRRVLNIGSDVCSFNPLRFPNGQCKGLRMVAQKKNQQSLCEAGRYYATITSPCSLQWISAVSTAILMFVKGTGINKSYLVPLFALQAPASVISWIQGEYGAWSAFLALIVRLFFFIPGELDLPFMTLLLVIVAPYQAMKLRGVQPGIIISLVIAVYLAFQHFTRAGSLEKTFSQGAIIATLAVIAITVVPLLLLV